MMNISKSSLIFIFLAVYSSGLEDTEKSGFGEYAKAEDVKYLLEKIKTLEQTVLKSPRYVEEDVKRNTENIQNLNITIGLQTENIEQIREETDFIKVQLPPVGSIIAWLPTLATSMVTELPVGWQRCDGQPITQGPMAGTLTPDLNSSRRFLRGGSDSIAGSTEEDTVRDHLHHDPGHTHEVSFVSWI